MRRTSRKMRLIPIDATKNIVQFNTQIATLSVAVVPIAIAVGPTNIDETDAAKVQNVEQNSSIRGFDIRLRLYNESGVTDSNSSVILIRKNERNSLAAPALAGMNALGADTWKNKIFHAEQAITGSQVSGLPMGFPNLKIPKRFHKMSMDDRWEIIVANNTGNNLRLCGMAIYKWYR